MQNVIGPGQRLQRTPETRRPARTSKQPLSELLPEPSNPSTLHSNGNAVPESDLQSLSRKGADVPDHFAVVRGGIQPLPQPGTPFSGAAGVSKYDACVGLPHGTIRATTAQAIRAYGGQARFKPEMSKGGNLNIRHVDVYEGKTGAFGEPEPNPVPKEHRIA
jgi:hypothetical protein